MKEVLETIGFPGILWGSIGFVFVLVLVYLVLKHCVLPIMTQKHEKDMKKMAYKNEKVWYFLKRVTEENRPLPDVDEKVKKLEEEISILEGKLKVEEKQTELLKKLLKTYEDSLDKLNIDLNI